LILRADMGMKKLKFGKRKVEMKSGWKGDGSLDFCLQISHFKIYQQPAR
jgi:hypothetical protein